MNQADAGRAEAPVRVLLLACLLALSVVASAGALPPKEKPKASRNAAPSLPPVYFRRIDFSSNQNCAAVGAPLGRADEVFMVAPRIDDWIPGKTHSVSVVEFFSGRRYRAQLLVSERKYGVLRSPSGSLGLDCNINFAFGAQSMVLRDGSYLTVINVDDTGQTGEDVSIDPNDLGTQALARKRADGTLMWSSLLAVRDKRRRNSVYELPGLYDIKDSQFISDRLLGDDTLLLVYGRNLAVRLDLRDGSIPASHADVRVVPLDEWARMKRDVHAMAYGEGCTDRKSTAGSCSAAGRNEIYFYGLQDRLFPHN
jgi:hypothetical protein